VRRNSDHSRTKHINLRWQWRLSTNGWTVSTERLSPPGSPIPATTSILQYSSVNDASKFCCDVSTPDYRSFFSYIQQPAGPNTSNDFSTSLTPTAWYAPIAARNAFWLWFTKLDARSRYSDTRRWFTRSKRCTAQRTRTPTRHCNWDGFDKERNNTSKGC
jgi:hypothetical protein